jgi:hypothetical protein
LLQVVVDLHNARRNAVTMMSPNVFMVFSFHL